MHFSDHLICHVGIHKSEAWLFFDGITDSKIHRSKRSHGTDTRTN